MTLVESLLARIDEVESETRESLGSEESQRWALEESGDLNEGFIVSLLQDRLAWSAAAREIIAEHAIQDVPVLEVRGKVVMSGPECRKCAVWENEDMDGPPHEPAPCKTLRLLASALQVPVTTPAPAAR